MFSILGALFFSCCKLLPCPLTKPHASGGGTWRKQRGAIRAGTMWWLRCDISAFFSPRRTPCLRVVLRPTLTRQHFIQFHLNQTGFFSGLSCPAEPDKRETTDQCCTVLRWILTTRAKEFNHRHLRRDPSRRQSLVPVTTTWYVAAVSTSSSNSTSRES